VNPGNPCNATRGRTLLLPPPPPPPLLPPLPAPYSSELFTGSILGSLGSGRGGFPPESGNYEV